MKETAAAFILICALSSSVFAETIKLPAPKTQGQMSLEESIYRRRSAVSFYPNQITNEQLSQLLYACQGVTDTEWNFRAAPSANAAFPLEIYLVNSKGVYHYIPAKHALEQTLTGDKKPSLVRASLGQSFISEAPVCLVITAVFARTREKSGARADRYVILEAGHAAENVLLQATALRLSAVPVGSFWDDVVASTLKLPPEHDPLYLIPIGHEKR